MYTNMFIHEKCCAVAIDKIPSDIMERLLLRQNDYSSPFKYNLIEPTPHSWLACLIIVICIEFIFALPLIGLIYLDYILWDWNEHPIVTFLPFLSIVGIWINEYIIRDTWRQWRNPLKKQTYLTPMYLVHVTSYEVDFYPLNLINDDIQTVNNYENLKYVNSTSKIKFKDGASFGITFPDMCSSTSMTYKINEFRNMFDNKLRENDYIWLVYMDDFKSLYERTDLLKNTKWIFFDKIDLIFFLSNCILVFFMAIGMKMIFGS